MTNYSRLSNKGRKEKEKVYSITLQIVIRTSFIWVTMEKKINGADFSTNGEDSQLWNTVEATDQLFKGVISRRTHEVSEKKEFFMTE